MPGKKYVTVSARLTEKEYSELVIIAERENISISALLKLCISAIVNGELQLEKGELKMHVDTHNHAVFDDSELDYFEKRIRREFRRLEEGEYPEEFINLLREEMIRELESRIDMLPKKFDKKKMKDMSNEWS